MKQKRLNLKSILALLIVALTIQLTSCVTSKSVSKTLPVINFPDFPIDFADETVEVHVSDDKTYMTISLTAEKKEAVISTWFWLEVIDYVIQVDAAEQKYDKVREVYQ